MEPGSNAPVRLIGRYALFSEIASGGMATVHFGRLLGSVGFARTVAIKRLHPHFAKDADFAAMFLDEARVAARVQHPNVVPTLDVVALEDELFLVMEYVAGESLSRLMRNTKERGEVIPPRTAVAIIAGALHGLHAAHEATSERGEPLGIVHRDVSPQNVLVGRDGSARVLDFGVAKAVGKLHSTRDGSIKGKVAYMAPEQIRSEAIDRRADVYAAGVVLWELLTLQKLFRRDSDAATLEQALFAKVPLPSTVVPTVPPELDAIVKRALERDPAARYQTAQEMALELERALQPELASNIGAWVREIAADTMNERAQRVAEIESASDISAGYDAIRQSKADEVTKAAELASAVSKVAPLATSSAPRIVEDASLVSASMSERAPPEKPTRRTGVAIAAIAGVGLLGAVAVFASLRGSATVPVVAAAPVASLGSVSPQASAAQSVAPMASEAPVASVSAAMPPSTSTPPATATHAATTSIATSRPHPSAKPSAAPADDCSVPYTVDATGAKVYKRQCL